MGFLFPVKIIKTTNGGGVIGVDEQNDSPLFKVYPNPATEIITIEANNSLIGSTYFITYQIGHKVFTGIITNLINSINIIQFAAGVYFVQVENQTKGSFKVIKK